MHLVNMANAQRLPFWIVEDSFDSFEGHFHVRMHLSLPRGRLLSAIPQ